MNQSPNLNEPNANDRRNSSERSVQNGDSFDGLTGSKVTNAFGRSERIDFYFDHESVRKEISLLLSEVVLPGDKEAVSIWQVGSDSDSAIAPRTVVEEAALSSIKRFAAKAGLEPYVYHGNFNEVTLPDSAHPEVIDSRQVFFFNVTSGETYNTVREFLLELGAESKHMKVSNLEMVPQDIVEKSAEEPSGSLVFRTSATTGRYLGTSAQKLSVSDAAGRINAFLIGALATGSEVGSFIGLNKDIVGVLQKSGPSKEQTINDVIAVSKRFLTAKGLSNAGQRVEDKRSDISGYVSGTIDHISTSSGLSEEQKAMYQKP